MTLMTRDEIYAFLNNGTMTGKISTASLEGTPHVAPVWFVVDGLSNQDVKNIVITFTTYIKSLKARHLLSNPQVCLCVDDQTPPYSFVIVNGIAEVNQSPDEEELLKIQDRLKADFHLFLEDCAQFREYVVKLT